MTGGDPRHGRIRRRRIRQGRIRRTGPTDMETDDGRTTPTLGRRGPPVTPTLVTATERTTAPTDDSRIGPTDGLTDRTAVPPPLHQLPHKPHQFSRLEGLGEEGINAHTEPDLDLVLAARADDGEGQIPGLRITAEPGRRTQPVEPGHDDIEGDHIRSKLVHHIQTLDTIGRGHDLKPLKLEIDPDQLPDDLVVVHDKDPAGRAWHNSRVGRPPPPRPGFPHFSPVREPAPRPPMPASRTGPRIPVHDQPSEAGRVLPVAAHTATTTPP
ncbi:hypothetical protein GCM10010145_09160 [Streptomyces ruber]|uniref:Uncharacterized protein n=2 Tax=Streptomyces TaxID=1883 RepID=A0A918B815_9ACTN|nr:hypothetical protein GCM10010145_09160 [Streptomyces ruber]